MHRLRIATLRKIERNPSVFEFLYRLQGASSDLLASPETNILLEGFPRSANTYSLYALRHSQNNLKISGHTHRPGNVILGLKYKIPICVLIRNPHDAVKSLLVRNPQYSESNCLRQYISFYSLLLPRKNEFLVAEFEDVVANFDTVIDGLNSKYKLHLKPFKSNIETNQLIEQSLLTRNGNRGWRYSYLPEKIRNTRKSEITIDNNALLNKCNELYERFTVI